MHIRRQTLCRIFLFLRLMGSRFIGSCLLGSCFVACGGSNYSSGGENGQPNDMDDMNPQMEMPETGVFIDSPVQGLSYLTASQQGFTNENGEFNFLPGEEVLFSIGNLELPPVVAMAVIDPYDIFATDDIYDPSVINLARMLQSLDVDGDAANGIEISADAHAAFTINTIDFSSDAFDETINTMLANAGSASSELISSEAASNHLFMSLGIEIEQGCGSDHPSVGSQVAFTTYFHDVSGTLTVTDNCTLTITNFVYDGEGPAVAFYSGVDGNYVNGQALSSSISGQSYNGGTIVLNLPPSLSLDDFNSVSVWCYAFNANFGDVIF